MTLVHRVRTHGCTLETTATARDPTGTQSQPVLTVQPARQTYITHETGSGPSGESKILRRASAAHLLGTG